jgi:hypothetical protein
VKDKKEIELKEEKDIGLDWRAMEEYVLIKKHNWRVFLVLMFSRHVQ